MNAHPHATKKVAIVHNGIIENYKDLIAGLKNKALLNSETDSEVIAHLLTNYLEDGLNIHKAITKLLDKLQGAFALGILISNENKLIAVKKGSPLAIGYGEDQNYIGSDAVGLAPFTKKISYLEDGDWAVLEQEKLKYITKAKLLKEKSILQVYQDYQLKKVVLSTTCIKKFMNNLLL